MKTSTVALTVIAVIFIITTGVYASMYYSSMSAYSAEISSKNSEISTLTSQVSSDNSKISSLSSELAGALALFSYNGPILDLKAKGMGEFLVSTVWGPLFIMGGFSASAAGRLSFYAFLISIPSALIMMAAIYSNNYRDIETDIAAGVRSFAYRTRSRSNFIYAACIFGAYALQLLYIILGILPLSTLMSFFTIPYAAFLPEKFSKKAVDIDAKTGLLFTAYNFLVVAGLIV
ncbi:MAG: prenyltransferase [Nitrososphaeria archaeon]